MPSYRVTIEGYETVEVESSGFQQALDAVRDALRPYGKDHLIRAIEYEGKTLMVIDVCQSCSSPMVETDDRAVDVGDGVVCEGCLAKAAKEFDSRDTRYEPIEVKVEDPWQES